MPRRGVVVLANPALEGELVQAIDQHGEDMVVVRRCADLAEVRAAARSGIATLAVLEGEDPDLDATALADMHGAGMAVVILALPDQADVLRAMGADAVADPANPTHVVEALISLDPASLDAGPHYPPTPTSSPTPSPKARPAPPSSLSFAAASTYITRPAPPTHANAGSRQVGQGAGHAPAYPPSPTSAPIDPDRPPGHVIAVWGTSGAPGRSTVALNVAAARASMGPTILIDADTAAPSLAHMLGLPVDVSGLAAMGRFSARGGIHVLQLGRALVDLSSDLRVLTGLSAPQRWREVSPPAMAEILTSSRLLADSIVVDVTSGSLDAPSFQRSGGARDDVMTTVLRQADTVAVVARGDAVGLSRLGHALRWWEDLDTQGELHIVINQVSAASAGPRPVTAVVHALETMAAGATISIIPEDSAVAQALLRGQALIWSSPDAPAAKALADLARSVAPRVQH